MTIGKSSSPVITMWMTLRVPRHPSSNTIQNTRAMVTAVSFLYNFCSHLGMRSFKFHRFVLVPLAMGGSGGQSVVSLPH